MKKYLTLVVIALLAIAPFANAATINLLGTLVDNDASGTLTVGDKMNLVINSTVALDAYDFTLSVSGAANLIETNGGPAALTEKFGAGTNTWVPVNRQNAGANYFGGNDSLWGYSGIAGNAITKITWASLDNQFAPGDLVWGLAINVTGTGALNVILGNGAGNTGVANGTPITDLGSLSLNVVPEPITVALMGLGGLFVARKKARA